MLPKARNKLNGWKLVNHPSKEIQNPARNKYWETEYDTKEKNNIYKVPPIS